MGAEVGSLYQLFVEVVPFEGSVARKRKEEVRNYQITDDEPQAKETTHLLRPLCPLSVVRCGGNRYRAFLHTDDRFMRK